jgi:hypothetical protein
LADDGARFDVSHARARRDDQSVRQRRFGEGLDVIGQDEVSS